MTCMPLESKILSDLDDDELAYTVTSKLMVYQNVFLEKSKRAMEKSKEKSQTYMNIATGISEINDRIHGGL